ncbi:MAG: GNAT family N-acetyltransferase, partial [Acidimicrobiia bacterium]|nr:GNAT family N-acetyltransferase [Acidimicrobiia bacterium]
ASLCLLAHDGVVTYWYTGALREYSKLRASDLMVWRALEIAAARGSHTFDFGGAGKPDEEYGVRDFKVKFGGELVNFGRNVSVHSANRKRISERGYELVRRFA